MGREMREQAYNEGTGPPLSRAILAWLACSVLVLLLSLGGNLVRPLWRGLSVSAGIVQGAAKLQQQRLANDALEAELAFLKSEEGKRWAAWRYLGMVPPGWHVGRIVEGAAPVEEELTRPQRIQAWLGAARERSARQLRQAGEVLRAYCGRRELDSPVESRNQMGSPVSKRSERDGGGTE